MLPVSVFPSVSHMTVCRISRTCKWGVNLPKSKSSGFLNNFEKSGGAALSPRSILMTGSGGGFTTTWTAISLWRPLLFYPLKKSYAANSIQDSGCVLKEYFSHSHPWGSNWQTSLLGSRHTYVDLQLGPLNARSSRLTMSVCENVSVNAQRGKKL